MHYKNEKEILIEKIEELVCRGSGLAHFPTNELRVESDHVFVYSPDRCQYTLLTNDPEVARLVAARAVLLNGKIGGHNDSEGVDGGEAGSASQELQIDISVVSEFQRVWKFLESLKQEKDHGKAILGLIECMIFLLKVVTALSTCEAGRGRGR